MLIGTGAVTGVALVTGVWPVALLFGFSMLTTAPTVFPGSRFAQQLTGRSNSTRAQQNVVGYTSELPLWALLLLYYGGDPVIIAGLIVVTAWTAALVAVEIRREGWSRKR